MKKVLLFLAIFGVGFAVLWMQRTKPVVRERPPDATSESTTPGEFTPIEVPGAGKEHDSGQLNVQMRGKLDFVQRKSAADPNELKPHFELHSGNVVPISKDVFDMHDLQIVLYDLETEKKRAEMVSPLSRVKVSLTSGTPRLSETEPVQLTNVDLTLFEGGPVVPLHLKIPKLDWNIGDSSFVSNDRVHINGTGLEAEGSGLSAKTSASSLELLRDASIRLTLDQGQVLTLTSGPTGAIAAQKLVQDGVEFIDLTAREGAQFVVVGPQPMTISAQTIHMLGRKSDAGTQGYVIVHADAEGNVDATSRGDRFKAQKADFSFAPGGKLVHVRLDTGVELTGGTDTFFADHSEFEFDAKGDLERATLTGSPHGQVEVGRFLAKERPDLNAARADIAGAGPLVVTRTNGDHVDLTGPATLELPELELVLQARDRIVAYEDTAAKSGEMTATGDVVLDYGPNKLASDALNLKWLLEDGAPVVHATSNGVTTLNGTSKDGRKAKTVAQGGLDALVEKQKITITEARDVEITSLEAGGLHAKAQIVHAFDPDARTFTAEGDVTFDSSRGEGGAQRVVAVSRDEMRLFGTPDSPARYDFAHTAADPDRSIRANVRALEIRAREDHVEATGVVTTFVETKGHRLDLESGALDLTVTPEDALHPELPREFHAHGSGGVTAKVVRPNDTVRVSSDDFVVDGRVVADTKAGTKSSVTATNVRASKDVHIDYSGAGTLLGDGDLFTLDEAGFGRLSADPDRKVRAKGRFVGTALPYTLEADWVEFDREHVEAENVRVRLDATANPVNAAAVVEPVPEAGQDGPGGAPAILKELRAHRIHADKSDITLSGEAHIEGVTQQDEVWFIDAASVRMHGDFADAKKLETKQIAQLDADGGFHARLGDRLEAEGDALHCVPDRVRVEGAPARMMLLDAEWQSAWIQYDTTNMLLSTDKGSIRARVGAPGLSWSIDYESMQPFDQGERTILVLRNPRLRFGSDQLVAEWTLFWVDRNEWRKSGRKTVRQTMSGADLHVDTPAENSTRAPGQPAAQQPASKTLFGMPDFFAAVQKNPLFRVLSEVYVEGNIEAFEEGERTARASAIYLDIVEMQGWIQDADVSVPYDVRGVPQRLRAKAEWMRISPGPSGPSLRAENAELTACGFDQPHYVIETGDLRITPSKNASDNRVAYGISARKNRLRFENGLQIPLPAFAPEFDEKGQPLIDRLVLGNSAKYGVAFRATVNAELGTVGKATGKAIATVLDFPETDIRGGWHYNLGILGARGVLLGMGIHLDAPDKFHLEADFDGIPDSGADKGLVRVDEDDRSLIRTWFRARARYTIREGEWVDLALSRQSDAGVQSEFFEHDYLRYEAKDNYLHWRKAKDEWYFNASAKIRVEDRRDVDELPSVGAFRGRTQIGTLFENPTYYTGYADAAFLRRRDGDARYYKPYEDGLGDRDIRRFDTQHRIEMPFSLGALSARGTPYVEARGTLWDEGADAQTSPTRAALIVGFDAATTFWRRAPGGSMNTITPTIGVHGDVASHESGGDLVHIDSVEDPIDGRFVDFGVRSRWWRPDTLERFDVDVRASHGSNLPDGQKSGIQPIAVLAELLTFYKSIPVGVTHDARYDTRTGKTTYSLSSLGVEPWTNIGLEFGYQRGLATLDQERLFEAASIAARWRWTTKWELEAGQTYPVAADTGVSNNLALRQLGHDFVTEFDFSYRSGEGSTFAIGFQPRLSWKRSSLGLLDRWLGAYH